MKRFSLAALVVGLFVLQGYAQDGPDKSKPANQLGPLTVEKIMRDPKWMGVAPTNFRWASNSQVLTFNWNPANKDNDDLYMVSVKDLKPVETNLKAVEGFFSAPNYSYNNDRSLAVFEKGGDIYLLRVNSKEEIRLTNTVDRESSANFMPNGNISFQRDDNFFKVDLKTGAQAQLSNFNRGKKPVAEKQEFKPTNNQDTWLKNEQTALFDVFKISPTRRGGADGFLRRGGNLGSVKTIQTIYADGKQLNGISMSPDGRFVTYRLTTPVTTNRNTIVPNYVTRSGYTEDINGRTKVGEALSTSENYIYDTMRDSVYNIHVEQIPGIKDLPDYVKDYPKELAARTKKNEDRAVNINGISWNENGTVGIVTAESTDNKDRWILKIDGPTGNLSLIDRQRDEAWIGGPGIGRSVSWIDNNRFYYQSEATGYSHLYTYNVQSGEKKQLTSGKWEVQRVQLSNDKTNFYISANKEHPGITHFYKMSVNGGNMAQITSMKGGNEVSMSPDEKWIAINYSYMDKPWELYVQANQPGAKAVQITKSTTPEFDSYKWRQPEMVTFKNRYGDDVYARVYPTANPAPSHPAVVFVHGAGYLQNVHFWWSQYFREYMFNNLLADNGYTVIDIDYTGSSGYGRNHRTGIYRHMGGKDLTDQVDGVKMLVEKYGVNPKNVGLYGGSYGGFITLMGMFNEPDVFAAGGALRSVTDWAHYNHGYTSNILNEPYNDENAYKISSPINFANGLKGNLLMAHGMVDDNVNFQDIVRLTQRLIELGKDNWELAVYPVETHGFVQPSSWTDEYKRIFKLFNNTLKR